MELTETIKYFAKFPKKEGVLNKFKRDDDKTVGYLDLKSYITAMDQHSLIPEIEDLFVQVDDKQLGDNIKSINGWFMLIEPAGIHALALNDARLRDTWFTLQITIARGLNARANDQFGEFMQQDNGLNLMMRMHDYMLMDDKQLLADKRWLDNPFQIDPIEPFLLFGCKGWQMTVNRNYRAIL